ncbi:hypothetical protein ACFVTM_08960 [Arthrobacter sp. NPDC058130]|uniref:hypothetical protein n=1 Tax=Arthrobacter sp. NPDC058130 TaxID=3346353 RepID=UPI0036E74400
MSSETPLSQPPRTETPAGFAQPQYPVHGPAPKASGLRVATGVVALVIAPFAVLLVGVRLFARHMGPSTPFLGWMNFLLLVGAVGCLVTGIVILAKQRKRGGTTPWLVGSFAGLIVLGCLGLNTVLANGTPGGQAILIPCALAVAVLAALVIILEKRRR